MAIIQWPDDVSAPVAVQCVLCEKERPPDEITAGLCDAQGNQTFACNGHFSNGVRWVEAWARFADEEDGKRADSRLASLAGSDINEWSLF